MKEVLKRIAQIFTEFNLWDIPLIIAICALFYFAFSLLKKNHAKPIIGGFFAMFLLMAFAFMGNKTIPDWLFIFVPALLLVVVITVFTMEIKRDVQNAPDSFLHRGDAKKVQTTQKDLAKVERCVSEIIKALQNMSKNNVGAIIVLSSGNVPTQVLESGVSLGGMISAPLIESVFFPKTPLHDGAMIVSGDKIVAAGCFLPLSQSRDLPKDLGTRHRAGIGITENVNVTSLIVSEETGIISIASEGRIRRYADTEMLKKTLKRFYWQDFTA